tara:strand:+ start:8449 stop:9228 length:780 start_codon:yes stop_codon:yes gene_type:complete
MTTAEFSNEFDLMYDNASGNAPGINLYEKSVFLTLAQEEIVKETYSGYTQSRVGFEGSERRRRQLSELVGDYKTTTRLSNFGGSGLSTEQDSEQNLISSSQFFGLPDDLLYIVLESVTLGGTNSCLNGKKIKVKPVTHDEFQVDIDNPFKKPNLRKAWRMDLTRYGASKQQAELFAIDTISEYHVRYVRKPKPIILADFEEDDDISGMGLSIDGYNTRKDCELNTEVHRDILIRAVDLAVLTARENNLMTRVQVNKKIV